MKQKNYDLSVDGFVDLWAEFHEKALLAWDEELEAAGGTKQPVMLWSSELTQARRIQQHLSNDRCAYCMIIICIVSIFKAYRFFQDR